jgi:cytochrome c5
VRLKFLMLLGALVGTQSFADSGTPAADQDVRGYNLGLGRWVFTQRCLNCHSTGVLGAPRFRKPADWSRRLDQGLPALIEHTIKGFEKLTEREVAAAVAYVVDQSRRVLLQSGLATAARPSEKAVSQGAKGRCDPIADIEQCSTQELQDALLIQMLWLLAGGER